MKITTLTMLLSLLTGIFTVQAQGDFPRDEAGLLEFYCQYSDFTHPGAYAHMYEGLPESLPELCHLIKAQFLHPYAELPHYRDVIPKERWMEFYEITTTQGILEKLSERDSRGFVEDRKPEDKLVMGCRDYALVLASVLKSRGVPARLRAGHADYLIPDFHASHVVCEVWSEEEDKWMLVDPGLGMVDFSREKFDYSNELWVKYLNKEINPEIYGFPGRYAGEGSILGKISGDISFLLGSETQVNMYAPVLEYAFDEKEEIPEALLDSLNRACELMKDVNAGNLAKLRAIYEASPALQVSRTFQPQGGH